LETAVRRHAVWACVVLAYLVVFPYFERLNNPNENVRVWMTRAIVAHGTMAIDGVEREWGEVSDRATDGRHHYAAKAPGTSLLGVPVAFVHDKVAAGAPSKRTTTWVLRVFSVALPLALFLLVFARAVERETRSPVARDLLVLGLGLGTMMYPYGLGFVSHAQTAALLFGGYLAARAQRPALAGLLAGLAVVFEYPALFGAVVVAGYAFYLYRRRSWRFLLGALGPAVLLAVFHTALFGRPWEVPLGHSDDPIFRLYHQQGVLGFSQPRLGVVGTSLFSADYGLFVWSPFLLLGLAGAIGRWRSARADAAVILAVTLVMILFLSGMANWRGGWCAGGPRYIAAVVPFLAWGVALSWSFWQRRPLAAAGLGGLVLASVVACLLAGAHFPHYPLQLDDPLFDLTLPLLGQGYAPYGLGRLLGLRGLLSYLPLALPVAAALVLALRPLGKRAAIGVAVAAAFLAVVGLANGRRTADEQHAVDFVKGIWEPVSGSSAASSTAARAAPR
jgi:Glycosyltransferase family 87